MMMRIVSALVAVAFAASSVQATLVAYEAFDYPNDGPQLNGRVGTFGWDAGGWIDGDGDFQILTQDDTSLQSPSYPFAVAGDRLSGSGSGEGVIPADDVFIDLTQDGNTAYVSILWSKLQDGGGSADNVEVVFGSANNSNIHRSGSTSGDNFWLVSTANTGEAINFGETYMLVYKIESSAAGDDQYSLAIFDEDDVVPTNENDVTWDLTFGVSSNALLDRIRLVLGANATGAFDEIRIGTTYASVAVPEPASLALMGLGAVALLRRRRSR